MDPRKKTDGYAIFLAVAGVVIVVAAIFTYRERKALKAAETRLAFSKKWWEDSLKIEADIKKYPQKEGSIGEVWTIQDVEDAIVGADNPRVKKLVQEPLKEKYRLDLNFIQRRGGTVMDAWTYETRPLRVNLARMEDLGMFVSVIEYLFPQAKTTLINYSKSPDKSEGNGTVEISIYTEKEK